MNDICMVALIEAMSLEADASFLFCVIHVVTGRGSGMIIQDACLSNCVCVGFGGEITCPCMSPNSCCGSVSDNLEY